MIVLENVSTAGGVANGTRCLGRELVLDPVDRERPPDVKVLPDGTVQITLRKRPLTVNVELVRAHSQSAHLEMLRRSGATLPGTTGVVVAIGPSDKGYSRKVHFHSPYATEHRFPNRKNHVLEIYNDSVIPMGVDLSNTAHKYQGVTMPKYFVVNLLKPPGKGKPGVCFRAPPRANPPHPTRTHHPPTQHRTVDRPHHHRCVAHP